MKAALGVLVLLMGVSSVFAIFTTRKNEFRESRAEKQYGVEPSKTYIRNGSQTNNK